MPDLLIYTDPLKPGICQMPVVAVGDSTAWTLRFHNGAAYYDPGSVSVRLGNINGLENISYPNAFDFIDRLNNRHKASFAIAAGVPGSLTWDETPIGVMGGNGAWLIRGRQPPSTQLVKIYIDTAGTGYGSDPVVGFSNAGSNGGGATATAILGDKVVSVIVTASAAGVTSANVIFTGGGGSGAAAVGIFNGAGVLLGITVTNRGSGYTSAPTVSFSVGSAQAVAIVNVTEVERITVGNSGSGYTSAPTVSLSGGGGTGAAASAVLGGDGVAIINVTNGGFVYTSAPTVMISGGGAVATAARDSGLITQVVVTAPGSGYTTPPTVTFTGGAGSGAAATAIINGSGIVTAVVVTNPGSGYTSAPAVGFSGGGGSGAAATSSFSANRVASVTLTSVGAGYTSLPAVTFTPNLGTQAEASGIESNDKPYIKNEITFEVLSAVSLTPYFSGRLNNSGDKVYDDGLLVIRPRILLSPTFTLSGSGSTSVYSGTMDPVVGFVKGLLRFRRSATIDIEIFGASRLLFLGSLTVYNATT